MAGSALKFPKSSPLRSDSYRRYVASQECFSCGIEGFSQAAHPNHGKGLGMKTDDRRCFPLCGPRPGHMGCHYMLDNLIDMDRNERRELEEKYTAKMQERARADLRADDGRNVSDIDPLLALDFLRDNAIKLAQAKANRVYVEEFRKTLKARLMKSCGLEAIGAQEREAYAHESYAQHIKAIEAAVEEEELLKGLMVAAQAKIDVWRSLNASNRAIDRAAA